MGIITMIGSVKTTSIYNESTEILCRKHNKRHENKVNENKVLYYKALRCETTKNNKKLFSLMLNLQTIHFKLDHQKVDQHTGGKWFIHGTKRRKDNQLQSLELPCRIS